MSIPYQSEAVHRFAEKFEVLGQDFVVDGGGRIGRYRVSAAEKRMMITRYEQMGWSKWPMLLAILTVPVMAAMTWRISVHPFRISTFLLWLAPLLVYGLVQERRRVRAAFRSVPAPNYLGPSHPLLRRWIVQERRRDWAVLLRSAWLPLWLVLMKPIHSLTSPLDWIDLALFSSGTFIVIFPLIAKAWHQRGFSAAA